jgi:SAM-dependent methyltransferase
MQHDAADLRDFYKSPLGLVVRRALHNRIAAHWQGRQSGTMLGLGFATPFLGRYRRDVTRLGALMPASQGALVWPSEGPVRSVLVEEDQLPIPDNCVDRLLAVHCLENSERVQPLLREMWRVLAPQGRLLLIVPNRRGVWARLDTTPFGQGRPYSRSQLEKLLVESLFTPIAWSGALYFPPFDRQVLRRSAPAFERAGNRMSAAFAGVTLVEAKKEIMAPTGVVRVAPRVLRDLVPARREARYSQRTDDTCA